MLIATKLFFFFVERLNGLLKMSVTKFQSSWLSREINIEDKKNNGKKITMLVSEVFERSSKGDMFTFCKVCNCSFSTKKGFEKIQQHAGTEKHLKNIPKITCQQILIPKNVNEQTSNVQTTQACSNKTVALFNPRDSATRAELIWCMDVVVNMYSMNSCKHKKEIFMAMFPNAVPPLFSVGPTKLSYLVTEALGPYFDKVMLSTLKNDNCFYELQYDETTNSKGKE